MLSPVRVATVCGVAVGAALAATTKSARTSSFAFATTVFDCGWKPVGAMLTDHSRSAFRSPSGTPVIR